MSRSLKRVSETELSLIIFAGIAASIPSGTMQMISMIQNGEMAMVQAAALVLLMVAVVAAIIFVEVGQSANHNSVCSAPGSRAGTGSKAQSHLPLKVNFSGVIPPIFASSLLMFPATMAQFIQTPWMQNLQQSLTPSGAIYNVLFVGIDHFLLLFLYRDRFQSE